ncbi:NAD(P)H-dependent oxidoreductase, partial [Actinospica durhamensis]
MPHIVLISGSLRRNSTNGIAIATVRRALTAADVGVSTQMLDLGSLPHYNQDSEESGWPSEAAAARRMIDAADALVISTPSYNGALPGVLKNALDWFSRPRRACVLDDKPTAVLTVGSAPLGGADALPGIRRILRRSGACVLDGRLAIGNADALATADGVFTDPDVRARLDTFASGILEELALADVNRTLELLPAFVRI